MMSDVHTRALHALATMIRRSEKAQAKFSPGTAQHTLLQNRIKALETASLLIEKDGEPQSPAPAIPYSDLANALAPIASLLSKSEKAQTRLTQGAWQHTMLEANLNALRLALPLLENARTTSGHDRS